MQSDPGAATGHLSRQVWMVDGAAPGEHSGKFPFLRLIPSDSYFSLSFCVSQEKRWPASVFSRCES